MFFYDQEVEDQNAKKTNEEPFELGHVTYEEFAETTSAHGFQFTIGNKTNVRKGVWVVVVAFFVLCATYTSIQSTVDYVTGPGFSSEYSLVFDQPGGEPVKLADFLICDISPWDHKKAKEKGISTDMLSYLAYFVFPFSGNDPLFSEINKEKLAELEKEYVEIVGKHGNDVTALLDIVTRTCEETIIHCRMGMGKDLSGKECCDLNFSPGVYTTEGKCFNTAGKMDYYMIKAVKPLGMFLGVHIGEDVSRILNPTITPFSAISSRGITIVLSDPKDHPFISSVKKAYLLQPNTVNSVAIEKSVIDSTGLQDSLIHRQMCASSTDKEVIVSKSPGYKLYSKENCELSTMQNLAIQHLTCSLFFLPNPVGVPNCSPAQTVNFFQLFGAKGAEKLASQNYERTTNSAPNSCPLDCIKETYSARVSSHAMTEGLKTIISRAVLNTETKQQFAALTVHYPSFDSIKIVQHGKVSCPWLSSVIYWNISGHIGMVGRCWWKPGTDDWSFCFYNPGVCSGWVWIVVQGGGFTG